MNREEFEKRYADIVTMDFFWRLVGVLPMTTETLIKKHELEKLYLEVQNNGLI